MIKINITIHRLIILSTISARFSYTLFVVDCLGTTRLQMFFLISSKY